MFFVCLITYLLTVIKWVEHTDRVINNLNESSKLTVDLETGMRGFLLSGEEDYLAPYEQARGKFRPQTEQLIDMVSDNPAQVQRLERLLAMQEQWDLYAQEVIGSRRDGGNYLAEVGRGRGKNLTDGMRRELDTFINSERELRQQRNAEVSSTTLWGAGIYLVVSILFSALLALFGRRELMNLSQTYSQAMARQADFAEEQDMVSSGKRFAVPALERRDAVRQDRRAGEPVVELDHPHRARFGHRPQDRQRTQMVTARRQRPDARSAHPGVECLHPRHGIHQIRRIGRHIPQIGAAQRLERAHAGHAILRPHHGGGIAQLPWPVARAGPVGGATIPGRADQPHLHLRQTRILQRDMRQAHERRHPGVARQVKAGNRLEKTAVIGGHAVAFPSCPGIQAAVLRFVMPGNDARMSQPYRRKSPLPLDQCPPLPLLSAKPVNRTAP